MTFPSVVKVTVPSGPSVVRVATPGPSGPRGDAGPPGVGSTWRQGAGAPAPELGGNGDFYLNTANGDIYGPKSAGAWGSVIFNIAEGQQGPAGATGLQGPAGAAGSSAYQVAVAGGFVGSESQWLASLVGPQGPAGAAGATGPQGPAGVVAATAPITYDAGTQTVAITAATTSAAGSMSSADKTKLDGIEAGAQVNPGTVTTSAAGLQPASGYGTISYAAQVTLDFAARDKTMHSISLTGALELLTSNLANGREVRLRLVCDGTQRTLTFPTDWRFVGTKPANIAASKVAVLSLAAFGTTNADVVAAYAVQS